MGDLLTVFGIQWHHIVIQIVNFGIVVTALWFLLYRPILSFIAKRKEQIDTSMAVIDRAAHREREVKAMREQVTKEAYRTSESIIQKAKETSLSQHAAIMEEAERRRKESLEKQRAQLQRERERMLTDVERETAKIAVLAAEKILRKKITA